MADPIRLFSDWSSMRGQSAFVRDVATQVIYQDPLEFSVEIISRHELRVWFEPNWHIARHLAARFPHCTIYSIPVESDTLNLHRVPGWRPRRNYGVL